MGKYYSPFLLSHNRTYKLNIFTLSSILLIKISILIQIIHRYFDEFWSVQTKKQSGLLFLFLPISESHAHTHNSIHLFWLSNTFFPINWIRVRVGLSINGWSYLGEWIYSYCNHNKDIIAINYGSASKAFEDMRF